MRYNVCVFLAPLFFLVIGGCNTSEKSGENTPKRFKRYPYENVHIQYELSASAKGVEDLYIADYGRLEAVYSDYQLSRGGSLLPGTKTIITHGVDLYIIDPTQPKGQKTKLLFLDSLYSLKDNFPTPADIVDKMLENGQFQLEGTEMIAGLPCKRWRQVMGSVSLSIWNGLILRRVIETKEGDSYIQTAVAVDTTWKADSTKFQLPAGVEFQSSMPGVPPAPGAREPVQPPVVQ